jgi:hypothetical protein
MRLYTVISLSALESLLRGPAWILRRAEDPMVVGQPYSVIPPRDRVILSPAALERSVEPISEVDEK